MEIIVRQVRKGLYDASFEIWENGIQTGDIAMQGRLGSMEGHFQIRYCGSNIRMLPISHREAVKAAKPLIKQSPFRPYTVSNGNSNGIMFHDQIKTGFMKSAGYHLLLLDNIVYYLYFVGFGEQGICAPVYMGDEFIAEIRKDCVVKDDLHEMRIMLDETSNALPLILLTCYTYVITYYKAGQKILQGTQKSIIYTKNDYLLSKCRTLLDYERAKKIKVVKYKF